jgi:hypothetical protein
MHDVSSRNELEPAQSPAARVDGLSQQANLGRTQAGLACLESCVHDFVVGTYKQALVPSLTMQSLAEAPSVWRTPACV